MSKKVIRVIECKFDPERDIQAVEQFGFVDLKAANVTSSIPVIEGLDEQRYNCIEDPRSIGARPSDQFEAAQASKAISGYTPPSSDKTEE